MEPESSLSVAGLARGCAEAMAHYRRRQPHDPQPCYELFRQALAHHNQEAWTALYHQYHGLVRHWLGPAPEDTNGLVNQAFERFWQALSPARFQDFATLDQILAYLKRCAQSVAIDARRQAERQRVRESALAQRQEVVLAGGQRAIVEEVLDQVTGEQLREHLMQQLNSPQERLAFLASFEWDLEPRTIAERWPHLFGDAREVSRVKERICRRLQRDGELRAWLKTGAQDGGKKGGAVVV